MDAKFFKALFSLSSSSVSVLDLNSYVCQVKYFCPDFNSEYIKACLKTVFESMGVRVEEE